jgi:hypothetical protein
MAAAAAASPETRVTELTLEDYPIDFIRDDKVVTMSARGFLTENGELAKAIVAEITPQIMPHYRTYAGLKFSNTCGPNAQFIVKTLKHKYDVKIIYLIEFESTYTGANGTTYNANTISNSRNRLFGRGSSLTMGPSLSYHALPIFVFPDISFAIEQRFVPGFSICLEKLKRMF